MQDIETESESETRVELAAIPVCTEAETAELNALTETLERSPLVQSAAWPVSTTP